MRIIQAAELTSVTYDNVRTVAKSATRYLASILAWTACTGVSAHAQCGGSDVGGVVYREYKVDGAIESSTSLRDRDIPLAGVLVTVYDANSAIVGTNVTDSSGAWLVDVSSVGAQPVLVEFGLNSSFFSGPVGSNNASSIVIANPGDCSVDFTQSRNCDHCEDVPTVVAACFPDPEGGFLDPTLVQVSWDDAEIYSDEQNFYPIPEGSRVASKTTLADASDTFGVAGLAWNRTSGQILSGVYHKWGLTINQGHMGELYATTVSNSTTALWLDLETILGAGIAGNFTGSDAANRQKVGYIGFTDVEISAENDELYVYNASTREVFVIPINPDGSAGVTGAGDIKRFQIPETCSGTNGFGFAATAAGALGVYNGRVYATASCTGPGTANLAGTMYSFNPDDDPSTAVFRAELTIDYSNFVLPARAIGGDSCCGCAPVTATLTEWLADHGDQEYAPWMYDVDFDEDAAGNVYATIGTRNRSHETIDPAVTEVTPTVGSYLHRAFLNTSGVWELETNGVVGALTTGLDPFFTGNTSGCTNFTVNMFDRGPNDQTRFFHNEGLEGGSMQGYVASIPGFNHVVGLATDNVFGNFDSGFSFHVLTNGLLGRRVNLIGNGSPGDAFGKGTAWGDVEPLCELPPLEVGNLVWMDQDEDGLYEPGEPLVVGVTVTLYEDLDGDGQIGGVEPVVAATVTDGSGTYFFTQADDGLKPLTDYIVTLETTSDFAPGGALAAMKATTANNPMSETRDSDGVMLNTGFPGVSFETGSVGENNHAYDFGMVLGPLRLGDTVWFDVNNNGINDVAETGISNVVVELYTTNLTPGVDAPLASTVTDGSGNYLFASLLSGDYIVYLAPINFSAGGGLVGMSSSTGNGIAPDPDDDANDDDNGEPEGNGGIVSLPVTLLEDNEPITDGDTDMNTNLSVDFGLFIPLRLGDTVWFDPNNNGTKEPGEGGISNVVVELYGTHQTAGVDSPLASTVTDGNGNYLFADLVPDDVVVYLPSTNFTAGAPLEMLRSSTGNGVAPDPDDNINDDDNGDPDLNGGILARPITLSISSEPINDGDTDANSNLSVDFGFFQSMSLGDAVWFDENNNGANDVSESGISNVVVELYAEAATPGVDMPLANDTTDMNGTYLFENLVPGTYVVFLPSTNFLAGAPLEGLVTSTGNGPGPDPDDDVNDDDNGGDGGNGGLGSLPVTLSLDNEPIDDGDTDPNSNLTVDFGVYKPMSLGNLVWLDESNSGDKDGAEAGMDGVIVNLFFATAAGPTGSVVQTDTTGGGGYYLFDDLLPGDYVVVVDAANFAAGQVLDLHVSSTGAAEEADPNSDGDSNDNGLNTTDALTNGVPSGVVTLSLDGEPTTETDFGPGGNGGAATPENSNLTVDFGFFIPGSLSVGDTIFLDENNNGTNDVTEGGISNVVVELYIDGDTPGTDSPLATDTTDENGNYLFAGLDLGDYVVYVPSSNFDPSGPLVTLINSTGNGVAPDPDDDANDDDNGEPDGNGGVVVQAISLAPNGEPTDDGDTNPNSNLSVDIGFYQPMSLGNRLWMDDDRDGLDSGELPVVGASVSLLNDMGAVVATTITDASGYYLFDDLLPGGYQVQVDASNFQDGGVLDGFSSTADGSGDTDLDDNGPGVSDTGGPVVNGVTSPTVSLAVNLAPTGEADLGPQGIGSADDTNSDLTIDFGFYVPVGLGDFVWEDVNANGVQDPGEPGVEGVTVNLLDATGATNATALTDSAGLYHFDQLVPGDYSLQIFPPAGYFLTLQDVDDDTSDSDINATDGTTVVTTLDPGENDPSWDAGLYLPASIGDFVWDDVNGDGIQDLTETGFVAIVVNLYMDQNDDGVADPNGDDGAPVASTMTDTNGFYQFVGLIPNGYFVEVVVPTNNHVSLPVQGGDVGVDSDVTPSQPIAPTNAVSFVVELSSGEEDDTVDAGLHQEVTIGHFVWHDVNGNSLLDEDLTVLGLNDVEVLLYQEIANAFVLVSNLFTTTSMDGELGFYLFQGLSAGSYAVVVNVDTLPPGLEMPTTPRTYDDVLTPGEINLNGNFGFVLGVTAIELADFTAEATGEGMVVRWETGVELENIGFNVYRSEQGSEDLVQVNVELILAAFGSEGHAYELLDPTVEPGVEYTYWLEDLDWSFVTTMHGPVLATAGE